MHRHLGDMYRHLGDMYRGERIEAAAALPIDPVLSRSRPSYGLTLEQAVRLLQRSRARRASLPGLVDGGRLEIQ